LHVVRFAGLRKCSRSDGIDLCNYSNEGIIHVLVYHPYHSWETHVRRSRSQAQYPFVGRVSRNSDFGPHNPGWALVHHTRTLCVKATSLPLFQLFDRIPSFKRRLGGFDRGRKIDRKVDCLGKKLRERSIFVPPPPPNVRKITCRDETTQELPMHVLATLRLSLSSTPSAVRSLPRWHKHRPPVFFDFSTDTPIGRAILT